MKKKKTTARQRAIAKGVAQGLTPGQAYYRYRLGTKVKSGRTVQEARGHAAGGSKEKQTRKQRSRVARDLGLRIDGPIRERKRVMRSDMQTNQDVFVFSHLTHGQVYESFYAVALPFAQRYRKRHPDATYRFVYIGAAGMIVSGQPIGNKKWSDEWRTIGRDGNELIDHFEDLYEQDVKFLALYIARLGEYRRYV